MKKTRKFKTESKQLLELMVHSIYSSKEIFLRELISNASDALDKRHFLSLQDERYQTDDLKIEVHPNSEMRTIKIIDTGLGMTEEDLHNNLGVIAHSGSKGFLEKLQEGESADIIGQFGVGFYSSFIVAEKVEVETKAVDSDAYKWVSTGEDAYSVDTSDKTTIGTEITLYLREGEEFDVFLQTNTLQGLIKKYSDYIKYPIYMDISKEEAVLDEEGKQIEGKYTTTVVSEIINSQIALWKRNKKDVSEEEYSNFYMSNFHDYQKPLHVIHIAVEGQLTYNALLYIPANKSYDFYYQSYQKGLALYSKGVLIEEKCEGLITDAFRFVQGLVDSSDISLNISREMLQQDQQVERVAKNIEKKIKNELVKLLEKDREKYNKFYEEFGLQLKYGLYENFGAKKDLLKDLIMFKSSKSEGEYITLKEYVERMPKDQKTIYFAVGDSSEQIEHLPQMEQILENDIEVLYFFDDVDEFAVKILDKYEEKTFQSVAQGNFDFATEETKKELEAKQTENKDLLEKIKKALSGKVDEVKLTTRLKNSAVCLVGGEGLSLDMEKVLQSMPDATGKEAKAQRILELNPNHNLFKILEKVENNEAKMDQYANLLYNQALLIEGITIDDPVAYANEMTALMIEAAQ